MGDRENDQPLAVGLAHHQTDLVGALVKLHWMKTSEAWPKGTWPESHWTCFDETKPWRRSNSLQETDIGSVHQIREGGDVGKWSWSMTASPSRPKSLEPTSGTAASREEAVRRVSECYERMLTYYNRHRADG
jgi:hypothetical protein